MELMLHEMTIRFLPQSSLASQEFLRHPKNAEWETVADASESFDASSYHDLLVKCAYRGSVIERADECLQDRGILHCPDCGEEKFVVSRRKIKSCEHTYVPCGDEGLRLVGIILTVVGILLFILSFGISHGPAHEIVHDVYLAAVLLYGAVSLKMKRGDLYREPPVFSDEKQPRDGT